MDGILYFRVDFARYRFVVDVYSDTTSGAVRLGLGFSFLGEVSSGDGVGSTVQSCFAGVGGVRDALG